MDTATAEEISFATLQGWTDKDAYKGDPDNWKTAKQFIDEGNKHAAILKDRNQKLVGQVSELQSTMTQLVNDQKTQKDKAVKKAIDALKTEKAEAISESDGDKVNRIDDEIDRLKQEAVPTPTNPVFEEWVNKNEWYRNDKELAVEADFYAERYYSSNNALSPNEVYAAVEKRIKREFPDKFENPNKKEPVSMSDGSHSKSSPTNGQGYGDLPADAKQACDRFVKTIPGFTVEKYLKTYEWD